MGRTSNQIQIRVTIDKKQYENLKNKSKDLGMTLEHYSGLYLSGYRITKIQENPEKLD